MVNCSGPSSHQLRLVTDNQARTSRNGGRTAKRNSAAEAGTQAGVFFLSDNAV